MIYFGLLLLMQRGGHIAQALQADRHTTWIAALLTDSQTLAKQQAGLGAQMYTMAAQAIARIPTHAARRLPSGSPGADSASTLAYSYHHNC